MRALFFQAIRFVATGFLNTAVDFAVLNLFAASFGVYIGIGIGAINAVSFSAAVLHSYFWNKYWAFGRQHSADAPLGKNLGQFVGAALLGVAVIGGVILGAGLRYGFAYFLFLLVALLLGEVGLWKIFRLAKDPLAQKSPREFFLFAAVSLIGVFLNSGIVSLGTVLFPPQFNLNQELWTNLIKAGATGVSLIWNFLGYKLVVFKR